MIIVDTSVLVSIINEDDADHQRCADWYARSREPLLIPATLVAEVCYMISETHSTEAVSVEADFLRDVATSPRLRAVCLEDQDYLRMAELVEQYADFPLGGSDASIIAVAERLNISTVATLDHRHFRAVRPNHVEAFTLLP
ncbi:MAG: VapC toxin family PIN domain ribonuclease [Acidimicrobiales bacterium]|nr:MAG: VapC toxin family PIN domain ribonuclease [Acidimicrobiales bacterium]